MVDFQNIFDGLGAGIILLSLEGEDFYVSPSASRLLELESAEMSEVREKLEKATGLQVLDGVRSVAMRDKRDDLTFFSYPDEESDLKNTPLTFHYLFKKNEKGEVTQLLISITPAEQLFHDKRMKDKLMSMAVHDVKTPLSSVKESSSLVWDGTVGELNDMQKKCMDIARKELVRLHRILENIIRIGQFEVGQLSCNFEKADLGGIILEIAQLSKEKCSRKKIIFKQELNADELPHVLTSRLLLDEGLFYLLDYVLEKADPSSEVRVSGNREDGYIKITFSYTGFIPSSEERKTIFSDFWDNKQTALIRKDHIDAFSLRMSSTFLHNIGGRIETAERDTGINEFTVFLPVE